MAPRKTAENGKPSALDTSASVLVPAPSTTAIKVPLTASGSLQTDPFPSVVVNNANLGEIKGALDDIVKKYLSDQSFTPSLVHPTVHLALGYSSIIISLAGVLYSLRISFEESKPVLWISVIGYFVLQSALWAWKRWVEKGEVYRGKRRRMVKRIETDHVQIISSTNLDAPPLPHLSLAPHTRPSSPSSTPSSPVSKSNSSLADTGAPSEKSNSSTSISSLASTSSVGPTYLLTVNLSTTSNNGKSLIHKARMTCGKNVGELVDEDGGVEEGEVKRWLGGMLLEVGLVSAEGEGMKLE